MHYFLPLLAAAFLLATSSVAGGLVAELASDVEWVEFASEVGGVFQRLQLAAQ